MARASSEDRTRESSVRRVRRETLALLRQNCLKRRNGGRLGTYQGDRASTGQHSRDPCRPKPSRYRRPRTRPPRPPQRSGCECADADSGPFLGWVGELVHRHRRELARVARAEGLTPEDAFDAVQDAFQTFITLPAAHPLVDAGDESRRVLITLTRNVARNQPPGARAARPHAGDPAAAGRAARRRAGVEELIAAAEDQDPRCTGACRRWPTSSARWSRCACSTTSPAKTSPRALGITPGHVAVLLHRAKDNLLTCMTG